MYSLHFLFFFFSFYVKDIGSRRVYISHGSNNASMFIGLGNVFYKIIMIMQF